MSEKLKNHVLQIGGRLQDVNTRSLTPQPVFLTSTSLCFLKSHTLKNFGGLRFIISIVVSAYYIGV